MLADTMDDIVKQAMAKWPNVPHCYGWLALDARGSIAGIDTAGSFDGALQLIDRLAPSRDVRACHVRKWMETAYGRPVVAADVCSQGELEQGFTSSGGNIRDLLLGLTQTEAFLYRPAP